MTTKHTLKMRCGVEVEMTLDTETGRFECEWTPSIPLTRDLATGAIVEYVPWRNQILGEWAKRNGKKVIILDY